MKPRFAFLLLVLFGALSTAPARAERADRDKPMNIEADALRHDDLRQTSVFTGRVVLTKGTITIRGARVEVRQDADGFQYGTITADAGARAFYRQKREGVDEYIEGEAEVIEYDGRGDRVRFLRQAELRRLRGAAVQDEMAGSLIVYDNTTDVFTVDGNPGPAEAGRGGRVRAVLAPRNTPASAPAAPATLRSSPAIGGERR